MTAEQMNQAIAEWCGWWSPDGRHWFRKDHATQEPLPNYTSDLNAMHEALNHLRADQWRDFVSALWDCVTSDGTEPGDDWDLAAAPLIHTTAAQRAEALLRTIGKWED